MTTPCSVLGERLGEDLAASAPAARRFLLLEQPGPWTGRETAGRSYSMRRPLIIDGRNLLDPAEVRAAGFVYEGIGRPISPFDALPETREPSETELQP